MTTHTLSTGIVMTLDSDRGAFFARLTGDLSQWDATPDAEVDAAVGAWGMRVDWGELGVYGPDALPLSAAAEAMS